MQVVDFVAHITQSARTKLKSVQPAASTATCSS